MIEVAQASARPPLRPQKSAARSRSTSVSLLDGDGAPACPRPNSANSEASQTRAFSTVAAFPNRKTKVSGIPLAYGQRDEGSSSKAERRASKYGNSTAGSIKVQGEPPADSLGIMVQQFEDGESTYKTFPSYAGEDPHRKPSLVTITPLHIRRKKTPALPLDSTAAVGLRDSLESSRPPTATYSSPPTSPPALTDSVYGGSTTDRDSVRSSLQRTSWPAPPPLGLNGEKKAAARISVPSYLAASSDPEGASALACPIQQEPDIPGVIRSPSLASFTSSDNDDDEDDDSVRNFSLEDFPVPSSVLASPATGDVSRRQPSRASGFSGVTVSSTTSVRSAVRPDLFDANSVRDNSPEWDLATELEIRDRVFRAEMKAMSRADKLRRKELRQHFDIWQKPSRKDMYEASLLSVKDEYGNSIRFGSLFEGQRTIVCFIRHFWCSMCQSYVDAIAKVKPAVLEKYGLRLIIVSNGSWKMIKGYKKMLGDRCPYPIYTDRGKHVYTALGMTLRTYSAGKNSEKGSYLKRSMPSLIMQGVVSGLSMPMKPPGDQQQLGGEFVLGPGLKVTFCHRMKSTRSHAEIEDVLASVGVDLNAELENLQPTPQVKTPHLGVFSSRAASTITNSPRDPSAPNTGSTVHTARFPSSSTVTGALSKAGQPVKKDLGISSSQSAPDLARTVSSPSSSRPSKLIKKSSVEKRLSAEKEKERELKEMRRLSVPHIETPPPISPMSTGFLSSNRSSALPSPLGLGLAAPISADLETSSSRFSSSSDESERRGVGAFAKSIRLHLKVGSHAKDSLIADSVSINSRGSLRGHSPGRE